MSNGLKIINDKVWSIYLYGLYCLWAWAHSGDYLIMRSGVAWCLARRIFAVEAVDYSIHRENILNS